MIDTNKIPALVQLIDDPDENVFHHVYDQLISCDSTIIPFLEYSWENNDYGLVFQSRIEEIIHQIQLKEVRQLLEDWNNSVEKDLLYAAFIIAKYQHPNLDFELISNAVKDIQQKIWLELNDNQTIFEKINAFNHIFYDFYKFKGDTKNYSSSQNSYIDQVLHLKKGNPLSISLLYSYIGQKLDLPLYGVNLPNHFIIACMDESNLMQFTQDKNEFGVLFYINCFSKGSLIDQNEIKRYLDELKLNHERQYFEPCSNTQIIYRMLTNLIHSYQTNGSTDKVNELLELRSILSLD